MNTELWRLSASTLTSMAHNGEISVAEIVDAHLERIDAINPQLNAVTRLLADDARRAASAADRQRSAGRPMGPMHGVPVTIKEIYDVAGSPTTIGIAAFGDRMPPHDAPMIDSLRRAGAIPIGRTNMPDFATRWHTDNDLHGATKNPWDPDRSPGGSSGGDAVAVATGMVPIGIAGDYGGSLRIPASACGVSSLRPTPGRVPSASALQGPPTPLTIQLFAADGPIARTVDDLSLAYSVMMGSERSDPQDGQRNRTTDDSDRTVALTIDPSSGGVHPEVAASVTRAADALSDGGYRIVQVDPPHLVQCHDAFRDLVAADMAALSMDAITAMGSKGLQQFVAGLFEISCRLGERGYIARMAERLDHCRAWATFLQTHPLVVGPVSTELPFPVGYDIADPANVGAMLRAHRLTVAVNYVGLPAAAVPAGTSTEGLPVGVQLIGARFDEQRCLAAARVIEQRLARLTPITPHDS